MAYLLFYLAVVAACLLWSATCMALATRTQRPWLRRLLVAVGWCVPPLTILPWVGLTGWCALLKFQTTWFGPTLTAFIAALVGGLWIRTAGLSRDGSDVDPVAAGWPWPTLAVGCVVAKLVAFGALLVISHAVAAQGRSLRVEAAQVMATVLSPAPAADDNAAPLYERALAAFEADATLREDASPATNPLTADPTSPEATAILKRHAAALDLLRRATDCPSCRFDRDWLRPSIDMLLPEVQGMRTAARLLVLAARKAAADGDGAAALADVVRIHRIGMHAAAEPILVCGLVGQASDALALQALAAVLPRLDAKDLPRLETEPFRDFLETTITYRRHFLGEEAFGLATAADLADDRRGSMLMLLRSLQGPAPHSLPLDGPLSLLYRCFMLPADEAGYRAVMRSYRGLFENVAFSRPFPEVKQKIDEIQEGLEERRDGIFTALITPALGNVLMTQFRGRAMHATAQALVAATRARLAAGTVPATLDALVPDWLPAVPRDPFTATAPLVSKRSDDAWVVYSVGPDGEDDDGPPPPGTSPAAGNDDIGLWLAL